jgi:hypothetical protein
MPLPITTRRSDVPLAIGLNVAGAFNGLLLAGRVNTKKPPRLGPVDQIGRLRCHALFAQKAGCGIAQRWTAPFA